jgi:hypothetical protein
MKLFSLALIALSAVAAFPTQLPIEGSTDLITFTSCGSSGDSITVKNISVKPDPPVVGKPLAFDVTGSLTKALDLGTSMRLEATVGIFKVKDETYDMCKEASLPCPIAKGDQTIHAVLNMPDNIPAGVTISVKLTGKNKDGSAAFCLQGKLKFSSSDDIVPTISA